MNIGDISVIISVLAGMIAIPFAASSVTVADDYKYGLAAVLNSTPEFAANTSSTIPSLISKTVSDEGIKYSYRTPYGEYSILISPEKFEEVLLKAGKKVSAVQSSSEQAWELSAPSESLVINHSSQKIAETYRNLDGYLRITKENGWTSQDKSGTASEEELQSGMLRLEKEMNETISLMKNMSEKILNAAPEAQTNQASQQGNITINEFLPNPSGTQQDYNKDGNTTNTKDEYIELYNSGDTNVSLASWQIVSGSDILIISGVSIPAKGFAYFVAGNNTDTAGGSKGWSGSWTSLTNSGDSIVLKDNSGNTADSHTYAASSAGRSIGRLPDGSGSWLSSMTPTPGATNI
ncbi:MAG: lamin tail domain-containing protein [Candidatus Aenigmatarchaeota archaeon]